METIQINNNSSELTMVSDDSLFSINDLRFTKRELDIIASLIADTSSKKIANLLSISPKTVEIHLRNIMLRLGCNTREAILSFIEQNGKFNYISKHYVNLLIKKNFELELKKFLVYGKKSNINCLIFYYKTQKTTTNFLNDLENDLKTVGINITKKTWEKDKSISFFGKQTTIKEINYIIYLVSKEFITQLELVKYQLATDIDRLTQEYNIPHDSIILLSLEEQILPEINQQVTYFKLAEQKNYYFLILELLKKLLFPSNLDINIQEFKKQYNLLNKDGMATFPKQIVTKNITLTKNNNLIKNNRFFSWKWLILLISPICFSIVTYTINQKIKFLTYQTIEIKQQIPGYNYADNRQQNFKTWPLQLPNYEKNRFIDRTINNVSITKLLHEKLINKTSTIKPLVIYGLAGIGKTQIAIRYLHSKLAKNKYNLRIWFSAETPELLRQSFLEFARYLNLIKINEQDISFEYVRQMVLSWLTEHPGWLIVFDNVTNYQQVSSYLPRANGSVLITSKQAIWPNFINTFNIPAMQAAEALKLIQIFSGQQSSYDLQLAEKLDYLPLALAQAASYMHVYEKTAKAYLQLYQRCQQDLLTKDFRPYGIEHEPVTVTWNNSLKSIEQRGQSQVAYLLAKDFIIASAYLYPEKISKKLLIDWVKLQQINQEPKLLADEIITILLSHSLIQKEQYSNTFNIHRLLQTTIHAQDIVNKTQEIHIAAILDTLVQDFNKDARNNKDFQAKYQLLPHVNTIIEYANKYLSNKHIKLQVARLLTVKAYFYTQTGMTTIQNASALANLAKQYYEELADISAEAMKTYLTEQDKLNFSAKLLYQKLAQAKLLSSKERQLLPILYAANLYISGRMCFFEQTTEHVQNAKKLLFLSKYISDLIEQNTGQRIFYKILAMRDGILCFNNFKNMNQEELLTAVKYYNALLQEKHNYINEDGQKQYLRTDQYHKLVCYRRLIQIYTKLVGKYKQKEYCQEAENYIKQLRQLIATQNRLERIANYYNTIGEFYLTIKNNKQAMQYFMQASDVENKKNAQGKLDYPLADAYYGLAKVNFYLGNLEIAKQNINSCLQIRQLLYKANNNLLVKTKNLAIKIQTKAITSMANKKNHS